MRLRDIIDRIKLPFRKEKELFSSLYGILGFYPRNIEYYKQALMHKSIKKRNDKGKPLNNERLEFLGDDILDAAVGYIVYRHYEGKREGFLTNTRSKLVSRETLGKLAVEMGLGNLLLSASHSTSHNSYVEGNAFEALVGAIYLDRGYEACMWFWENRVLVKYINLDKVAFKEVNFKSKLLEWSQKNRVRLEFRMLKQKTDGTLAATGEPIDRSRIYGAQTPQIFYSELLKQAYGQGFDTLFTDDASVAERYGIPLTFTEGERLNLKITTPEDLLLAQAILQSRPV